MGPYRIISVRLAKGGRIYLVLRARKLDRPQRPGAPLIVAPFSGSTQDRIIIDGCCTSPSIYAVEGVTYGRCTQPLLRP